MKTRNFHTFTDTETLVASGLREIGAQARVAAFAGSGVLDRARMGQLRRDRDRALRRDDAGRAQELEAQIATLRRRSSDIARQRERESVVPTRVPGDQAVVRGRITESGFGRKGLNLNLIDADGAIVARGRSADKGAFELIHPPRDTLTLRVTNSRGNHLLDRAGIAGPGAGGACYLEIPIDGVEPMPPAPAPSDPDSAPTHVIVPSLRGLTEDAAREAARLAGLRIKITGRMPAPNLVDSVVDQEPQAGTSVERGSTIGIRIGAAEDDGFPDFRGAPLREAAGIGGLDLTIQEIELVRDPDNAGRVVSHLPQPGAPFTAQTRVFLSVGAGAPTEDLSTAAFLVARAAARGQIDFGDDMLRERFGAARLETLDDLRELLASEPAVFQDRLQIDDRTLARRLRQVTASVVARFPDG